ncbi:MAG: RnfABCDGE type electron transport complex subunit B [Firmicutes bacterium]|nr:RnfABCDGE type electron transport complex subunit B [Bacillota bacterium]
MDINNILFPIISVGGIGIVLGAILGFASQVFHVDVDPRVTAILECLPGANCGACGYPGCGGCANAIVEGKAPVTACPVGGAAAAAGIGEVMGVAAGEMEATCAWVKCNGTCENAKNNYVYEGIEDCIMASQLAGSSSKACSYGCMGLGSCVKACAFDAIHIVDGVAKVDKDKCVSCAKCVAACPKHLIEIIPAKFKYNVACSSKDAGKVTMGNCSVGCIGCKICEKACKFEAIKVIDGVAVIDYSLCKNCGLCAQKCPKGVITGKRPVQPKPEAPAAAPAAPAAEAPKAEAPAPATEEKAAE